MKKSLLAALATISLTAVSLVSGVAPASAVDYNTERAVQSQNMLRPGTPTVSGNAVVVNVTVNANEAANSFNSLTQYARTGFPLVINPGDAVAFTGGVLNTATQASVVNTFSSGSTKVFWKKSGDTQFTVWNSSSQTLSQLPTGTFVDFQVFRQSWLSSATPGTYQATIGLTVGGALVTPVPLAKNDIQSLGSYQVYDLGFSIRWNGGVAYTPSALDEHYSVSSRACIWPAELNLTNSSVIEVTYNNFDTANNSFAADNYVNVSAYTSGAGSFSVSGTETNGNEIFSVALTNVSWEAMEVYATAYVRAPTAHEVKPVFRAWLAGDLSKTNILQPCQKFESFAAPTLTSVDSASATLSWVAPANLSSRNWDRISVYVCSTAVTSVCGDMSSYYNMNVSAPSLPYDFSFSGVVSGTSVTLSSTSMRAAMFGPPSGGVLPTWSPTAAYRYFVFYSNNSFTGYKAVSALTAASVAALGASTPSTPSTPDASATVVRSEPVLKGFAGHSVGKMTQKTFALDASGLTGTPEVLINGKKLTYVKDAKGMLAIELPKTLKRGGSYDLVVSSPEGIVTVLGAIVVSADLPITKNTPTAFRGTSTALSAAQVGNIRALVNASEVGDTVTCTAYVSGATTDEVATARATNACAAATAVNPELKIVIRTAPAIFSVRNKVRVVIG